MSLSVQRESKILTYVNHNTSKTGGNFSELAEWMESKLNTQAEIPQSQTPSSNCNIYQLFQKQTNENTAVKDRVNSYISLGDTLLSKEQVTDLQEKYDFNNLSADDQEHLMDELVDLAVITNDDKNYALDITAPCLPGTGEGVYASWVPMKMRHATPNFSLDYILNGNGSMIHKLNQKISFCNTTIEWLSDENNRGINQYEDENRQRLETYRESCEKVLNVIDTLKTI